MKQYPFVLQERREWCVPVSLYIVLSSRGIRAPSQRDIADILGVGKNGFNDDLERIDLFLKRFGLKGRHTHPKMVFEGGDYFLKENLPREDIIAIYNHIDLIFPVRDEERRKAGKHFALVLDYQEMGDRVWLHDAGEGRMLDAPLGRLTMAMQLHEDSRYGFYVIGN